MFVLSLLTHIALSAEAGDRTYWQRAVTLRHRHTVPLETPGREGLASRLLLWKFPSLFSERRPGWRRRTSGTKPFLCSFIASDVFTGSGWKGPRLGFSEGRCPSCFCPAFVFFIPAAALFMRLHLRPAAFISQVHFIAADAQDKNWSHGCCFIQLFKPKASVLISRPPHVSRGETITDGGKI